MAAESRIAVSAVSASSSAVLSMFEIFSNMLSFLLRVASNSASSRAPVSAKALFIDANARRSSRLRNFFRLFLRAFAFELRLVECLAELVLCSGLVLVFVSTMLVEM